MTFICNMGRNCDKFKKGLPLVTQPLYEPIPFKHQYDLFEQLFCDGFLEINQWL